jgi:hypothetical protein
MVEDQATLPSLNPYFFNPYTGFLKNIWSRYIKNPTFICSIACPFGQKAVPVKRDRFIYTCFCLSNIYKHNSFRYP